MLAQRAEQRRIEWHAARVGCVHHPPFKKGTRPRITPRVRSAQMLSPAQIGAARPFVAQRGVRIGKDPGGPKTPEPIRGQVTALPGLASDRYKRDAGIPRNASITISD